MAFTLKQGDRRPHFVVALKDNFGEEDEAAIDLTTASAVVFNMRDQETQTLKVNRGTCTHGSATGVVTYAWGTADTDTVGTYDAEVEITWSDTKRESVPNGDYFEVEIVDDIA